MGIKFDQQKTKYSLLNISISLGTVLSSMSYLQSGKRWLKCGSLWDSLLIPIILSGEISKLILSRYFAAKERDLPVQRQKKKTISAGGIVKGFTIQAVCALFYGFICVIFGAPVLHSYEETLTLSIILTLLTVSPAVFLLGAAGALQIAFCEVTDFLSKIEETALQLIKYTAVGAICGAWMGSVAAPLDWDREWQIYPIPNIIGMLLGYGIINIYSCSNVLITTGRAYMSKKQS